MAALTEEHQSLLQLLYVAPIGLIKTNLNGDIALANAVAAKLLMPLSRDGELNNLFTVLEGVVPDLKLQVARFSPSHGLICESMQIQVDASDGDRQHTKFLSLTLTKIDEGNLVASLSDVSEERRMAFEIAESETRMRDLIDAALDAVISMDAQGRITAWNRQAESIFGWTKKEVVGLNLLDTLAPLKHRAAHQAGFKRFLATGQSELLGRRVELTALRRSGEEFPVELSILPFTQNGIYHFTAFVADISARKLAEELVRQLAYYDPLTGLANRMLLKDRLIQSMKESDRSRHYGALMFIDLDNFKPINDLHGHDAGDLVLAEVAKRLKSCVRQIDTVSRIGGDEFVVLLDDLSVDLVKSHLLAELLADKIKNRLADVYNLDVHADETHPSHGIEHHCSASIGVVLFLGFVHSEEEILKSADVAMYQAKELGRNRVCFHEPRQS